MNPHVAPFLRPDDQKVDNYPILSGLYFLVKSEIQHRIRQLSELDILSTSLHRLQNILSQKYDGDITIVPDVKWRDYRQLVSNPSKEAFWDAVMRGTITVPFLISSSFYSILILSLMSFPPFLDYLS